MSKNKQGSIKYNYDDYPNNNENESSFYNKIKGYIFPWWTSGSVNDIKLYIPKGFNNHKILIDFIINKLKEINIYEFENNLPLVRKLFIDEEFSEYKKQALQFHNNEIEKINSRLWIKFFPLHSYVQNLINEYKNKVVSCDICKCTGKPWRLEYENKLQRYYSYKIAATLFMFGLEGSYGCTITDGQEGLWYLTDDLHKLWRTGKCLVCDNCLTEFIDNGLLEEHEDSEEDYSYIENNYDENDF